VLAAAASPEEKDGGDSDGPEEKAVAGGPVGAHAADEPVGQHAAGPAKVSASAKVTVPPATRVGADAE
jgi:hypothetical protein